MSFLGGAECSTAGNPLSQFTKHVQDDKSLQHDRLVGRAPGVPGALGGFRSTGRNTPQDKMIDDFLHQAPVLPEIPLEHQHAHMRAPSQHQSGPSTMWGPEDHPLQFQTNNHTPLTDFRPEDFASFRAAAAAAAAAACSSRSSPMPGQQHQHQSQGYMSAGAGPMMNYPLMASRPMLHHQPSPMSMYPMQTHAPLPLQQQQQQQQDQGIATDVKGKGKVVELDETRWEEQFAQMELHDREQQQQHAGGARNGEEEAMDMAIEAELNHMDEKLAATHDSETGFGDLEAIWRGIQAEKDANADLDAFEQQQNQFGGFGGDWADGGLNSRLGGGDPPVGEYLFEAENLFRDQADPFGEGVRIVDAGGNLSLAALAFEAAVQRAPDHVEAWVYLGSVQAQNEKEEAAIRALEHALRLDPNNTAALMGLAVSYTNEGYDSTAYRTLERWLSVTYPQVIAPAEVSAAAELGFTDRQRLHERVTDLFIRAARLSPGGEHNMDPDVQVGLGVLFYGAEDYGKAVDCFTAALQSSELGTSNQRSQVHLLWNRLGATLANSGQSEEAIAAYEKALAINPNFVRARYNLGVSCINIGCQDEAAAHLLAALDMHKAVEKSGREKARELLRAGNSGDSSSGDISDARLDAMMMTQNRSTTLYDTLRRVFTQMGRRDLADKVVVGVDPDIFRGEFDF